MDGHILGKGVMFLAVPPIERTRQRDIVKAAFEYADGLFRVNGRVFDASAVQVALATADRRLNTFLGVSMPVQAEPKDALAVAPDAVPAAVAGGPALEPLPNSASVRLAPNVR